MIDQEYLRESPDAIELKMLKLTCTKEVWFPPIS